KGQDPIGGQTIKTRVIIKELKKVYKKSVIELDTEEWRKNRMSFLFKAIRLLFISEELIILPAQNGVKFLLPFFVFFSKILRKRIHYIVVGAWLSDVIDEYCYLKFFVKRIDYIYPQTATLKNKLDKIGINKN